MDSATLTVELIDRSGPGAAAATNPNAPGAANVPGTGNVADFQETVTQRGAGANAGQGSSTGASTTNTPVPQASSPQAPAASPVQPSGGLADPLYGTVRDIYQADPTATAKEIAATLGLTEKEAGNYLAQAKAENAGSVNTGGSSPAVQQPTGQPQPAPVPQSPTPTPQPAAWDGPDSDELQAIIDRAAKVESLYPKADVQPAAPAADTQTAKDDSLSLSQAVKSFTSVINPAGGLPGIGQSILGQTGAAVGNFAQTAINAAPQIVDAIPGASAALAPLLAGLAPVATYAAPIAAGVGVAAAAVAVPVAAGYAIANEAERAITLGGRFSPDIQREQALSDIRQIYADLRTAAKVGDEAGAYVGARSRLDANLQNLRDQVGENLIPIVTDVVETMSGIVKAFDQFNGGNFLSVLGSLNKAADNKLIETLDYQGWFKFFRDLSLDTDPLKDINPFGFADMYDHLPLPSPFSASSPEVDPKKVFIRPIPGL